MDSSPRKRSKVNILHLLAASDTMTALDAVENLLKTGQRRVDECEAEGLTALHVAAAWDNLAMCQMLLFYGADPFREDHNGRTARDMATGSVKRFFERLYDKNSSEKGRTLRASFMRTLRNLFTCSAPVRANNVGRSRSWSPQYKRKPFAETKQETDLRSAFQKHQPLSPEAFQNFISFNRPSYETFTELPSSSTAPTTSRSHTNDAAYVTALSGKSSWKSTETSRGNVETLSSNLKSMKIDPKVPSQLNDWMTEDTSSYPEVSYCQVPADLLKMVHEMTDSQLKMELEKRGVLIGPLFNSTRVAYEERLARLIANIPSPKGKTIKYSWALEACIDGREFPEGSKLDEIVRGCFMGAGDEEWREGNRPTSFCYILIDPSMIDLPAVCTMKEFIDAIFYVGKGKRSRPLQHIVDAVRAKTYGESVVERSKKLQRILELWRNGHGVVSLHVFQNIIPVEAFTREAAMIDAIGVNNLTNIKRGDYYGVTKEWTMKDKTIYGSYLLSCALQIFRVEGCREIFEHDVQEN